MQKLLSHSVINCAVVGIVPYVTPNCNHSVYDIGRIAQSVVAASVMSTNAAAVVPCFYCGANAARAVVCSRCHAATYCSHTCQVNARTTLDHDTHCATFKLHAPSLGVRIYSLTKTQPQGAPPPGDVFAWFERELLAQWPDVGAVPVVNARPSDTVDDPARKFIDAQYVAMMSHFFLSHGISNADVNVFMGEMREIAANVPEEREVALEYNILGNHAVIEVNEQDPVFVQINALLANKKAPFPEAQITALLTTRFDEFDLDATEMPAVVDELRLFHEYGPSFTDSLVSEESGSVYLDGHPSETALGVNGDRDQLQNHRFSSFVELVYYWNWERVHEAYAASVIAARVPKRSRADTFPDTLKRAKRAKRQHIADAVERARQAHRDDPTTIPLEMRLHVAMWLPARDIIRYLLRVAPADQSNVTHAVVDLIIKRDFLDPMARHIDGLSATDRANVERFCSHLDAYADTHDTINGVPIPMWHIMRPCMQYVLTDRWLWKQNYKDPAKLALLTPAYAYVARKVMRFYNRVNKIYHAYVKSTTGFLMLYYGALADKLAFFRKAVARHPASDLGKTSEIVYTGTSVQFKAVFNWQGSWKCIEIRHSNPSPAFVAQVAQMNAWIGRGFVDPLKHNQEVFITPINYGLLHMFVANVLVTMDPTLAAFVHMTSVNTDFIDPDAAVRQSVHPRARRMISVDAPAVITQRVNVLTLAPVTDDPYVMRAVYDPTQPPDPRPVTAATRVVEDDMTHEFAVPLPT